MADTSAPMTPRSYRKKPVVIQAIRLEWDNVAEVAAWCHARTANPNFLNIKTLEGIMRADVGDWIIQGVKGEFYPCKDDIFRATYEPSSAIPAFRATERPELGTTNYNIDAVGREGGKASTETVQPRESAFLDGKPPYW